MREHSIHGVRPPRIENLDDDHTFCVWCTTTWEVHIPKFPKWETTTTSEAPNGGPQCSGQWIQRQNERIERGPRKRDIDWLCIFLRRESTNWNKAQSWWRGVQSWWRWGSDFSLLALRSQQTKLQRGISSSAIVVRASVCESPLPCWVAVFFELAAQDLSLDRKSESTKGQLRLSISGKNYWCLARRIRRRDSYSKVHFRRGEGLRGEREHFFIKIHRRKIRSKTLPTIGTLILKSLFLISYIKMMFLNPSN